MGKQAPRVGARSFYDELKAEHTDPSTVVKQRAAETAERPGGLVPIFLAIQGSSLKPPGPDIRESFLWRLGGDWGHTAAASRLCGELGLVSSHEQLVSDQIRNGLTRYESWVDAGRECLVPIEFDITLGRLRYRDRLMWDANEPPNKAGPDEFAQGVCSDLGLGPEFAAAIAASMAEQQNAKRQAVLGDVVRGRGADKATPVVSAEELASLGPRLDWVDAPADAMEQ